MKNKIFMIVAVSLTILIVLLVVGVAKDKEKSYIGVWKGGEFGWTYKVTKETEGFYKIFVIINSNELELAQIGKYDTKKNILVTRFYNNADKLENKLELFENKNIKKEPTIYDYWIYNEKKDQVMVCYKVDYDKSNKNTNSIEKWYLTRVKYSE